MTTSATFRTPPRILIPKLAKSRDDWKEKATTRKAQRKALQIRVRDLQASRDHHRRHAQQLQKRVEQLQALLATAPPTAPAPTPVSAPKKWNGRGAGTTPSHSSDSR